MQWLDGQTLAVEDVRFELEFFSAVLNKESTRDCFVLRKTASMIEDLVQLHEREHITNLIELGIYKGGSCAFYHLLFRPDKLVAIDINRTPEPALVDYIQHHNLSKIIKLYYDTNQSDYPKLLRIVKDEFPGQTLDLIVDDASHLLSETRISFMALFPFLRPGGYYIIEDWGWAHWPDDIWQNSRSVWATRPALTNLIVEIMMVSASRPDLVSQITVNHRSAIIRRGAGQIDPGKFDLAKLFWPVDGNGVR